MAGKVMSEGDRAMRSNVARDRFHLDGSGIKIGVISVSYNAQGGAARDVISGELPGRRNPQGYTQSVQVLRDTLGSRNDEGRAMLQIIHDIAPGATLLFHSTGGSEEDFATAVRSLVKAGADIIVDDIGFTAAPLFQDGVAAQAVTQAVNQGVTFFSSAGNDGDRAYTSPFRSGRTFAYRGNIYEAHDFDPSSEIDLFQDTQIPQATPSDIQFAALPGINLLLGWDQAVGQVTNDLELFLLDAPQLPDAGGQVLSDAFAYSPRPDAPLRGLEYSTAAAKTVYLVIARRINATSPAPEVIQWSSFTNGGDNGVKYQYVNDGPGAEGGSTLNGHPNARGAIAVGAASYTTTPAFGGKIPVLEDFSSQGGTPILFDIQGNRLATPEVRQKPEIVAPDRVSTALESSNPYFDFSSFSGTSAAAPHAAAVAALMLQRAGGRQRLTPAQVLAALQSTALPMNTEVFQSGAGFVQADRAVLQSFISELRGTDQNNQIQGQAISENIYGLAGNDILTGAGGLDAIFGGSGRDRLKGEAANDYLLGEIGNDTLLGGRGNDWLEGGQGRDRLSGEQGNDVLLGGTGDDILSGGQGRNRLIGGRGADRFDLDQQGSSFIQDFQLGRDRIGLPKSIQFGDLKRIQEGRNTVVKLRDRELATLHQFQSNLLSANDFRQA